MTFAAQLGDLAPTVKSIFKSGLSWRANLAGDDWRRSFKPAGLFTLLDKPDDAETLLKYQLEKLQCGSPPCILLRPGKFAQELLPLMQIQYGKDGEFEKLGYRAGFLRRIDEPNKPYGFFGFRYESPEKGQTHDFFHAQPIRGFERNDSVQHYSVPWMPTRFPTFPITSRDLFELLVATLFSIQGDEALQSFTTAKDNARASDVIKRLRGR